MDTDLWLCPSLPTETLKWLSSLPILMQESFWWWQCSDRYITSLSTHLHTPFILFSLSLTSLMLSMDVKQHAYFYAHSTVQELCESRGGRPVLSVLKSLLVSVDVKQYWTLLIHWSQLVPNISTDICGHEALLHHHAHSEHRFPTMYTLAKRGWGEGWVGADIKAYLRWVSVPTHAFVSEGRWGMGGGG